MRVGPSVRWFRLLVACGTLALLAGLSGCGSSKASVAGKVTLDNKKLIMGQVCFVDRDKKKYVTYIQGDGTYRLPDIAAGEYKVYLEPTTGSNMMMMGKGMVSGTKPPKGMETMKDPTGAIPTKESAAPFDPAAAKLVIPMPYRSADSSGLTFTVKAGEANTFDIPMRSK